MLCRSLREVVYLGNPEKILSDAMSMIVEDTESGWSFEAEAEITPVSCAYFIFFVGVV
jgi:hypothetical protein